MSQSHRGVLDVLPAHLVGYLFEFLPQTDPLSEWVPGHLLTDEFVQRLRQTEFTGFAHAKRGTELRGIFVFFKGRLLEVWSHAPIGCAVGLDAYHILLDEVRHGGLALYKLPTDAIPAVLALTMGSLGVAAAEARLVNAGNLQQQLNTERFAGVLLLENGSTGQAWLFQRGELLFAPPLPDEFRAGNLHLYHAPAKAPKDLLEALAEEQRQQRTAELERIWNAALAVLNQQLGRGATQALETQKKRIISSHPEETFAQLRRFFEINFQADAVHDFEQRLSR
jgi:hypothetical protein